HIAAKIIEPHRSPGFIEAFLGCSDITEPPVRCGSSVFRGHSFADEPFRFQLNMRLDFFFEIRAWTAWLSKHRSCLSGFCVQHSSQGTCITPLLALFSSEFVAAFPGEGIEPSLTIVVGKAPLRRDEAAVFKPLQCRIERSVVYDEYIFRLLLYRAGYTLS